MVGQKIKFIIAALLLILAAGIIGYQVIEGWSLLDATYMTVITLTSVGFGETHPLTPAGQTFTIILILAGVTSAATMVSTLFNLLLSDQFRRSRRYWRRQRMVDRLSGHAIICGYGRMGHYVAENLTRQGLDVLIIENDDEAVEAAEREGVSVFHADATQEHSLTDAGIERASSLIATLDSDAANVFVVLTARGLREDLHIIARADMDESESKLRRAGADRVILPYALGGQRMASLVTQPGVIDFLDIVSHSKDLEFGIGEIPIAAASPFAGRSIADLRLRQDYGVTILARFTPADELHSHPKPGDVIEAGSRMIVMGTTDDLETFKSAAAD